MERTQEAGVPAKTYGAEATDHVRLDRDLGLPGDAATRELFTFVEAALAEVRHGSVDLDNFSAG